jgi:hypothetical protein
VGASLILFVAVVDEEMSAPAQVILEDVIVVVEGETTLAAVGRDVRMK